jgi:hypothetical protein
VNEEELLNQFLLYITGELVGEIAPELAALIGESVTGATRDEALDVAATQAAELVKNITDGMRENMRKVLTEALDGQVGLDELKRRLRDGLTLDEPRLKRLDDFGKELVDRGLIPGTPDYDAAMERRRQELIDERAKTIARTESAKALEVGEQTVAVNRGATHKIWLTVSDSRVSEFCAACEAQGPIPIDEDFVGDGSFGPVATAPGHPNCRCTVAYITDTGRGEVGRQRQLQQEKIKRTEAALAEGEE